MLRIYNTLTREKQEFIPIEKGKVRFYHCGPTVYWTQHIGNLRAMVISDIVRRTFVFLGYDVNLVRNYTDVGHLTGDNLGDADLGEDRMEKGAKREGLAPEEIAQKYIKIFEKDTADLNILEPTHKPQATSYIPQMIEMISTLLDKDFAYITTSAIYFDVSKFPNYNNLNKQNLEENKQGAGSGDVTDSDKKSPEDFALWFFKVGSHANALQSWDTPWGEGFPGWHIECSAMSKALLGETIDIHMGGIEHIPVHHTNEIAQSEAANGVPFVHYWLHNEHLNVDNKKMAKSEGTGYSLSEIKEKAMPAGRQGYDPISLRYFYLQAHYRSQQNFTWEALEAAQTTLERLREQVGKVSRVSQVPRVSKVGEKYKNDFVNAISDDFNTPQALAVLWDVLKSDLSSSDKYNLILQFDEVLGLGLKGVRGEQELQNIPNDVQKLIEERNKAREEKDFTKSDEIRDKIQGMGYTIKDTEEGTKVIPN